MKWEEMSDRKRVALVAEKVMGWTDVWQPFFPSTDISHALKVMDVLLVEGWDPIIEREHGLWQVWFTHDTFDAQFAKADSIPAAICQAALKAVGVAV